MPRPFCRRRVGGQPVASIFKPVGIPLTALDEVVLTLDEFEAIRLADLDALYQEQAAERMAVSRPTFARIVDAARRKLADALVHGKALRIEGGPVHSVATRQCCRFHDSVPAQPDAEGATSGPGTPARLHRHRRRPFIPSSEDSSS